LERAPLPTEFDVMHPELHYLVSAGSAQGGAFIPPAAGAGADSKNMSADARLQILLVEDEAISALALKRLVARLGHEVCAVTAMAEDAIRLAGEILPDIIMMDIRLAGEMDGITAAREIRDRFGIGSIFMTANSDPATRALAENAQPLGFMAKPYSPMMVKTTLRHAAEQLGPQTRN
jgi:two-component system, response regulator PdtaR